MSTPVRVLYVIDEYRNPNAGTERQLYRLVVGLDRERFAPELAVLRSSAYIDSGAFPCPTRHWNIHKIGSASTLLRMRELAAQARDQGFRLVHAYFNDAAVLVPWFFSRAGMKVLSSRRDMGFWYTRPTLAALKLMARFTDGVVVNSRAVADNVQRLEAVPAQKLTVIYNGVDEPVHASPAEHQLVDVLRRLERKRIIGIVANIRPVKRIGDLVAAFHEVAKQFEDAILVVVGGGAREEIEAQARTLGIADRVVCTGQLDAPGTLIEKFEVAVLCSESEGLSNSIIEYMLHGKPIVATRTGGNPELVEDGVTGLLVPVASPHELAARITELMNDPTRAERLGAEARKRAIAQFSMQSMVEAHESLYARVLVA